MADNKAVEQKQAERLKYWKISRAAHKLKNRSTKNILSIHHLDKVDIYKTLSNEALRAMSNNGNFNATQEINRRVKRQDKTEVRKARYLEKLATKRAAKA